MYYTNNGIIFYTGDKEDGDREATTSELSNIGVKESNMIRIQEAKQFLADTDHKEFPSYIPKLNEDLPNIIQLRVNARQLIRDLK